MQLSLDNLNKGNKEVFMRHLGGVFEHSPWVAEAAFLKRPFENLNALHTAMVQVVETASLEQQLDLIRAHPDLAGKAARAGNLTESSSKEQSGAGLDSLTHSEYERFHELNNAYKEKFNFPFILAVKGHTKHSILLSFESRLTNDLEVERKTALEQISNIARFRLEDLLSG